MTLDRQRTLRRDSRGDRDLGGHRSAGGDGVGADAAGWAISATVRFTASSPLSPSATPPRPCSSSTRCQRTSPPPNSYSNIFSEWARAKPDRRREARRSLSRADKTATAPSARRCLAWAQTDPQAAIAWASQLPDAGARRDAREQCLQRVGRHPIRRPRAPRCSRCRPATSATVRSATWSQTLSYRDVPAAIALIEQMPAGTVAEQRDCQRLPAAGRSSDPQAAAQYVAALPPGDSRNNALSNVARVGRATTCASGARLGQPASRGRERKRNAQRSVVTAVGAERAASSRGLLDQDRPKGRARMAAARSRRSPRSGRATTPRRRSRGRGRSGTKRSAATCSAASSAASQTPTRCRPPRLVAQLPVASQSNAASQVASAVGAERSQCRRCAGPSDSRKARRAPTPCAASPRSGPSRISSKLPTGSNACPPAASRDAAVSAFTPPRRRHRSRRRRRMGQHHRRRRARATTTSSASPASGSARTRTPR